MMDYKDPQQARCAHDLFGLEIYPGSEYWAGDEGIIADPREDNYDANSPIVELLVQQLGIRYILQELGYERKTFE